MKLTPKQIEFWRAFLGPLAGLMDDNGIEAFVTTVQRNLDSAAEPTPQVKRPAPERESAKRAALVSDVMKRLEVSDEQVAE